MAQADLSTLVQRVLDGGHVNLRTLAQMSGHSYQTLRSWSNGRRTPSSREHLLRLADAFASSSEKLSQLAQELREASASM